MDKLLRQWITQIIQQNEQLIRIAVRQRAKFEGWLKFELAAIVEANGAIAVEVETSSQESDNKQRADISFFYNDASYDVELKTPNTNWRTEGVIVAHRPVTKNVDEIIQDGKKLKRSSSNGLVAFVMFPIPPADNQWEKYISRIASELQLPVTPQANCSRVSIAVDSKHKVELIVGSFFASSGKQDNMGSKAA